MQSCEERGRKANLGEGEPGERCSGDGAPRPNRRSSRKPVQHWPSVRNNITVYTSPPRDPVLTHGGLQLQGRISTALMQGGGSDCIICTDGSPAMLCVRHKRIGAKTAAQCLLLWRYYFAPWPCSVWEGLVSSTMPKSHLTKQELNQWLKKKDFFP